jgi:hypothetical protein
MFYYLCRAGYNRAYKEDILVTNYWVVSDRGGGMEDALAASERGDEALLVKEVRANQCQPLRCSI